MVGDILIAGYTMTAAEWDTLDAETRDELLGAVAGAIEEDPGSDDETSGPQLLF